MKHWPRRSRGFTLLELMVVIALVVFLFATAIEMLLPLRGAAERAQLETVAGSLQSAVGLESVRRAVHGGAEALLAMNGANPVSWLAAPPARYAGEVRGDYGALEHGAWAFDAASGTLFYRVRYPEYFEGSYMNPPGVRFRVRVDRHHRGGIATVTLEQLDTAAWTAEGSEIRRWLEEWL